MEAPFLFSLKIIVSRLTEHLRIWHRWFRRTSLVKGDATDRAIPRPIRSRKKPWVDDYFGQFARRQVGGCKLGTRCLTVVTVCSPNVAR